ncbi:MAG: hypothetical protein ACYC8V_10345 [Caulobacteraceae bacterium]
MTGQGWRLTPLVSGEAMMKGWSLAGVAALALMAASGPGDAATTYAQHLVDHALSRHPQVVVMALHATPPKAAGSQIVASNIGRIGKKDDADDLKVISTGHANVAVNAAGNRLEVEEPLRDVGGEIIGALAVVYPYRPGDDQAARERTGAAIAGGLAKRISNPGNLVDPWPYDPRYGDHTRAQSLVDKTLAVHPEVIILAIHASKPGTATDAILGSNIGRIGKAADADDLRVIERGAINREVNESGKRFEAELPLNDARGRRIGALGVVFAYHPGEDKEALVARARAVRDEVAAQIPTAASLSIAPD